MRVTIVILAITHDPVSISNIAAVPKLGAVCWHTQGPGSLAYLGLTITSRHRLMLSLTVKLCTIFYYFNHCGIVKIVNRHQQLKPMHWKELNQQN